MFGNGTVLLVCKVMSLVQNIRQMQISVAPSWKGPYVQLRLIASLPLHSKRRNIWI